MSSQDIQTPSQDATPTKTYDEEGLRLTKRVNALHRLVAYTRIIIRVIQLAAAIISILMTLDTLAQYYSTASLYQGGKYLWPAPTETNFAPTLLTLGEAVITLVLCSIVLISYSHGIAAADQWDDRREFFDKCVSGLTFILSASAAGTMFQTGNDTGSSTKSLWEFVCNATSEQQSFWYQYFDYGTFCLMQTLAGYMTVVHVITEIMNGLLYVFVYVQDWQDKKVEQREAGVSTEESKKTE